MSVSSQRSVCLKSVPMCSLYYRVDTAKDASVRTPPFHREVYTDEIMQIVSKLKLWRKEHALRTRYTHAKREPFFELVRAYLPEKHSAVIVDVGAGDGLFARYLHLQERYPSLTLLDHNPETVLNLKKEFSHVGLYHAPERLPFTDASVALIHLSHIVEHLYHEDLYTFLNECDRVLVPDGVLIISTPLLWDRFYDDLSHIKPYNPEVFLHYLTRAKIDASALLIGEGYDQCELIYRYRVSGEKEWGSVYVLVEALMRTISLLVSALGFRKYIRNGYTLVVRKRSSRVAPKTGEVV